MEPKSQAGLIASGLTAIIRKTTNHASLQSTRKCADKGYVAHDCAFPNQSTPSSSARQDVWVADDGADVRLLLSRAFKRCFPPVSAEIFADGLAMIDRVEQGFPLPKVLLLDYQMPGLDGLQTLAALKPNLRDDAVVLMFSAVTDRETVRTAYTAGVRLFLGKPVNGHEYMALANLCAYWSDHEPAFDPLDGAWAVTRALELFTEQNPARIAV
jgi:CheY-like chemotaxis protein